MTYSNATAMCFSMSLSARSQRLVPAITWKTHCQLWLSVRCTMPRNSGDWFGH